VINLDRLSWLNDGQTYPLKVFHAERHTTQSNFRIDTTIQLRQVAPPAARALAD
jgi:fibro-slime domain-containing protein